MNQDDINEMQAELDELHEIVVNWSMEKDHAPKTMIGFIISELVAWVISCDFSDEFTKKILDTVYEELLTHPDRNKIRNQE